MSGGTPVSLSVAGAERPLSPVVASNLLRIAHEALANARRHAHAARIDLTLAFSPRSVTLSIADDGKGMGQEGANQGDGTGITGMKERAADMAAVLVIDSAPDRGTIVRVEVPA
jgi:signal transduction histidine kinase